MKLLSFLLYLCASQLVFAGPIPGLEGPYVTFNDGKIVLTMKMQDASHPSGFSFPAIEGGKSTITFRPNDEEGGMNFEVQLDLEELQYEDSELPQTLSDGRSIPGIPGGAVKNAKRIDKGSGHYDISTFHSPKSFGVAIPFLWNVGNTRDGHHWLTWKGKNIGMLSFVNAAGDKKPFGMIFLRYSALKGNPELMASLKQSRKSNF